MHKPGHLPWGFLLVMVTLNLSGCDDGAGFQDVTARSDKYYVGSDSQAPGPGEFLDTPAANELAIDFGPTDIGSVKRRYLFLRNTGESDLKLISLEPSANWSSQFFVRCPSGGQFVSACPSGAGDELSFEPNADLVLEVEFAPQTIGEDSTGFELVLNAVDHERLTVNLAGTGVERRIRICITDCIGDQSDAACQEADQICDSDLSGETSLLVNFGDIGPDQVVTRDVTVHNSGELNLVVDSLFLDGADSAQFFWQSADGELPGTLAAGAQATLQVTYQPGSGGSHDTSLQIQSDGGDPMVDLAGRMLAPRVCPEPLQLDFGTVEVGLQEDLIFEVTNCGLAPLELEGLALNEDTSEDFLLTAYPSLPHSIAPEDSVEIYIAYVPGQSGSDSGGVDIYSNDITSDPLTHFTGTVHLWGNGIVRECQIGATPSQLNFGGVEQDGTWELTLLASNQGTDTCRFDGAEIAQNSPDGEFSILDAPAAGTTFEPGEILQVEVQYAPVDLGQDTGVLELSGDDADGSPIEVALTGDGIAEATCDLRVQPTLLQFGAVKPYHLRRQEVVLTNLGAAPCQVTGLELLQSLTYPGDFAISDGPDSPFTLSRRGEEGDQTIIEITFTPDQEGEHAGVLWFHTDDDPGFRIGYGTCWRPGLPPQSPEEGDACISMSGNAAESDLEVVPGDLDFGVVTVGCNSAELQVTVYNLGYFTIEVQNITLDDPDDPDFEIREAPALPFSLGWAEDFQVGLRYHPQDANPHANALVIETDDFDIPRFIIPLRGEGTHVPTQTDIFTQPAEGKADVLFVVDNSESMGEEQTALAGNFDAFINWAMSRNADFHIGVITTMAEGEEYFQGDPPRDIVAGELVAAPGRPAILTRDTPDLAEAFAENVHVGTSPTASTERGLAAARKALSPPDSNVANAGFLREEAKLYIIVVSDEDDQSDGSLDYFLDFFSSIKGPRNLELMDISSIVGDLPNGCDGPGGQSDPCPRYIGAAGQTDGVVESICTDNWAQSLQNVGLDAFAGFRDFPLSRPADPASIETAVNDQPVELATCTGCPDGWSYYPDTNSVYFGDTVVPERGARIEIFYHTVCAGD